MIKPEELQLVKEDPKNPNGETRLFKDFDSESRITAQALVDEIWDLCSGCLAQCSGPRIAKQGGKLLVIARARKNTFTTDSNAKC